MAGDLHDARRRRRARHHREQRVQVGRLGGGAHAVSRSSPTRVSTVPIRPGRRPGPRRPAVDAGRPVVVLPLVPVTPSASGQRAGAVDRPRRPRRATARGSSTTSTGTPSGRRPAARRPRRGRSGPRRRRPPRPPRRYAAPWAWAPGRAAYRSPGQTPWESRLTPGHGDVAHRSSERRPARAATAATGGSAGRQGGGKARTRAYRRAGPGLRRSLSRSTVGSSAPGRRRPWLRLAVPSCRWAGSAAPGARRS